MGRRRAFPESSTSLHQIFAARGGRRSWSTRLVWGNEQVEVHRRKQRLLMASALTVFSFGD